MVDLSLHILDVATNAFKANASILKVVVKENNETITVKVDMPVYNIPINYS